MKVTRIDDPGKIPPNGTPESVRTAKAVAAFAKGQSSYDKPQGQSAPIPVDANNVSVEEISAVQTQDPGQSTISEETQTIEEVKADQPKEEPKAEVPASSQLAILARKERALRAKAQQQETAFKAKEAELQAKQAEFDAKIKEYESGYISKAQLKQDTLRILAEEGVSYDELTQQLINQQPSNPQVDAKIGRLEATIAKLTEKLDQQAKGQQDQQTAAYQSALKQIETDVRSLVKSDPNFETVRATNSVSDVVELIEKTFQEEQRLLSVEEATQMVEDYLVDEAIKLTKIDKIKNRISQTPAAQGKSNSQTPAKPQQTQTMKTLTNAVGSTQKLSMRDRAIAAMEGRLPKP